MRTSPSSSDEPALERVRELSRRLERFEDLADVVRQARFWDYTVYDDVPGEQWLAIDRDDYQRIVDALANLDAWRPWENPLDQRLGDV